MLYQNRPSRACCITTLVLAAGALLAGTTARAGALNPDGVLAVPYQVRIGAPGALIKVTWNRPTHIPGSLVLQNVVWRDDFTSQLQIVGGPVGDSQRVFLDSTNSRTVNAFNGGPGDQLGSQTQITVPGLVPGRQYRYQVSTAFNGGLLNGVGNPVNQQQFMGPLSTASRPVTALAPSAILSPAGLTQVNPAAVEVTWQQTPGADTYVIWASTDPGFRKGKRVVTPEFHAIPVDFGGPDTVTATINLSKTRVKSGGIVYLAVGARNSVDKARPQPFGYIFSAPVAVQLETPPPPAP